MVSLSHTGMPSSVQIISVSVSGKVGIKDLRSLKDVIIPEGTEKIGSYWFWGSGIESIRVPVSVEEIGICSFYGCKGLIEVIFGENN